MSIRDEYLELHEGREAEAAAALAIDLMRGDAATFKAGYTFANALIAATECIYNSDHHVRVSSVARVAEAMHGAILLREVLDA